MKTRKSAAALITASLATAAGVALIPAALAAPSDSFTVNSQTVTLGQCQAGPVTIEVADQAALDAIDGPSLSYDDANLTFYRGSDDVKPGQKTFSYTVSPSEGEDVGCTFVFKAKAAEDPADSSEQPTAEANFVVNGRTVSLTQCQAGPVAFEVADQAALDAIDAPSLSYDEAKLQFFRGSDDVKPGQKTFSYTVSPSEGEDVGCTFVFKAKAAGEDPADPSEPAVDADFFVNGHAVTIAQCKAGDVKFEVADKAALEALTGEVTGVDDNTLRVVKESAKPAEDGMSITFPFEVTENPLAADSEELPCNVVFSVKGAASAEEPTDATDTAKPAEGEKAAAQAEAPKALAQTGAAAGLIATLAAGLVAAGVVAVGRARKQA